jgi:hypothetical protein
MIETILIYDRIPTEPYLHLAECLKSIRQFGYEPKQLGLDKKWGGLMSKPKFLKAYLDSGECKAEFIILCDAFDVFLVKSPDEIIKRYKTFNAPTVWGSEMNCFPEVGMACDFPHDAPHSPFRYLNSGFVVTTPQAMKTILDSMKPDSVPDDYQISEGNWFAANDQWYHQIEFHKQKVKAVLDYDAELVLNCCGVDEEMAQKYDPCAFHLNGGCKTQPIAEYVKRVTGLF